MFDQGTIFYISIVGGCGFFLLVILRLLFDRAERRRRERVEELKRFVAVKTTTDPNTTNSAKTAALESIATRFMILRRITTPLVLMVMVLLISAPFFGHMPAAMVTMLMTAATIVLGIAAKPVLENVIAGIMVSFSQPIRIGDLVSIEGQYSIVEQINLTYTIFKVWDFRRFIVPNSKLIQTEYFNYTLNDKWLWATVKFWVAYDTDLDLIEEIAVKAVKDCPQSTEHPPGFWITSLSQEGVECWVAGWVEHPLEAWDLRHTLSKQLVKAFQKQGIRAHIHQLQTEAYPRVKDTEKKSQLA